MVTSSLLDLRKFLAPEFVFGPGARRLAGRYARNLGAGKALVVSDPPVAECGWTDQVVQSLEAEGVATALFMDVSPNPRDFQVMEGAEAYRREGCDAIVAVGGGSPMDCAKGIGVVSSNGRGILDFEGVDNVARPGPPLICIPTTAGSSADVSQFAIVNDTGRKVKIAIVSKKLVPDAALIDPEATMTMSPELTANTGLDALTHAIEAYVSNASSPLTDLHALEAVRHVALYLPAAVRQGGDLEARSGMAHASLCAGLAFSNAILGAVHAMAHSLGGLMDLPHGLCNAILLDHVVAYNFDSAPERYMRLGRSLMGDDPALCPEGPPDKDFVLTALRRLKAEVGVTATLGELGVSDADLENLATFAMEDPCMATNPKPPSLEEVVAIFRDAF